MIDDDNEDHLSDRPPIRAEIQAVIEAPRRCNRLFLVSIRVKASETRSALTPSSEQAPPRGRSRNAAADVRAADRAAPPLRPPARALLVRPVSGCDSIVPVATSTMIWRVGRDRAGVCGVGRSFSFTAFSDHQMAAIFEHTIAVLPPVFVVAGQDAFATSTNWIVVRHLTFMGSPTQHNPAVGAIDILIVLVRAGHGPLCPRHPAIPRPGQDQRISN
jgi:hypothetical protein